MMTNEQLAVIADQICPMYAIVDAKGYIQRVGPTLRKLRPDLKWEGRRFFRVFDLSRPRRVRSMADLVNTAGSKLHLHFRDTPQTSLKGVLVPLPQGQGAIINLSFGISVLEAVRDYDLTSADFSPTDLTIEMLYLVEAKSAAMEASRQLNLRLQGAKIAAEEQAFTDTLTGLKNRRAMDHILDRLISGGRDFALMHLDLDYFKQVNDTLGHAAGDAVLQHVARVMVECTRQSDTVARVGGDEFVLIFNDLRDLRQIEGLARRLISELEVPIPYGGKMCKISASAGTTLSAWHSGTFTAAEILNESDVALYAAKGSGRAQHCFYEKGMENKVLALDH
ncbi:MULTISPECIES: GGDEF domain-containing protein [Rhodobacterales]|jgi:diguanylate cyclase (GGDEF)-like protein|uniref:Diguanylate cyclase n=1 Tax=Phaeobacter gallaeciensis TaxID=60890 RepID=A0A1B0ZNY9_9RHOB|nr:MULTISPECIES: GGDEF domain-containing protein [Phaeobacter]MEE2634038.1 GGDEF domain-containing protein [Pseudomonadota bacterium]ANP35879.1 diguanylate cyclase [Phaeobacter gallaeciensis]MDE4062366.1 GGDEF domain-containing protein [Phaeobacter gallaeciensis]MDE4098940.1 GGDEF domain-containing protein [Phaeobacter gallaeciensis]MDE4107642.1 GGDEF domain-containing protein [Phaeobacter gallaeciensis]